MFFSEKESVMSRYYTKSHEWVDCDDATKIASVWSFPLSVVYFATMIVHASLNLSR